MAERILMKGNEAIAEAAIKAGCRHYFGYPITPQTEIAAYMAKKMPKIGGVGIVYRGTANEGELLELVSSALGIGKNKIFIVGAKKASQIS